MRTARKRCLCMNAPGLLRLRLRKGEADGCPLPRAVPGKIAPDAFPLPFFFQGSLSFGRVPSHKIGAEEIPENGRRRGSHHNVDVAGQRRSFSGEKHSQHRLGHQNGHKDQQSLIYRVKGFESKPQPPKAGRFPAHDGVASLFSENNRVRFETAKGPSSERGLLLLSLRGKRAPSAVPGCPCPIRLCRYFQKGALLSKRAPFWKAAASREPHCPRCLRVVS